MKEIQEYYKINRDGSIVNLKTGRLISPSVTVQGYYVVHLKMKCRKTYMLHKLVMNIYGAESPDPKARIQFADGNKLNCHIDNLSWTTEPITYKKSEVQICPKCYELIKMRGRGKWHLNNLDKCAGNRLN